MYITGTIVAFCSSVWQSATFWKLLKQTINISLQILPSKSSTRSYVPMAASYPALLEMEEIGNIRLGSTKQFSEEELKRWTTLQQFQENQQLRILLSCRICRQNRIQCVLQCGHVTCWNCSELLLNCPLCGTPIRNRYRIYLHPPY